MVVRGSRWKEERHAITEGEARPARAKGKTLETQARKNRDHGHRKARSVMKSLTVKQVADRLGISPSLVYSLCATSQIRHVRHGRPGSRGTIRISEEALAEYQKTREQGRAAAPVVSPRATMPAASSPASPFSELDPQRLARAWTKR